MVGHRSDAGTVTVAISERLRCACAAIAAMGAPADDHEDDDYWEDYCMWDHMTEEEAAPLRRLIGEFAEAVEMCARAVEEEERQEVGHLEGIWRLPASPSR
jgi:hypothetical protein